VELVAGHKVVGPILWEFQEVELPISKGIILVSIILQGLASSLNESLLSTLVILGLGLLKICILKLKVNKSMRIAYIRSHLISCQMDLVARIERGSTSTHLHNWNNLHWKDKVLGPMPLRQELWLKHSVKIRICSRMCFQDNKGFLKKLLLPTNQTLQEETVSKKAPCLLLLSAQKIKWGKRTRYWTSSSQCRRITSFPLMHVPK